MLFYKKVMTLDVASHRNVSVRAPENYFFAARTNVIPLAAIEFAHAALEYPIAFVHDAEGTLSPVAVVGLDENNLYVDSKGRWQARYVPAYVRRYPFVPGEVVQGQKPVVCIDSGFDGYNVEDGEPLFDANGKPSDYLARAIELIQDYHGHLELTRRFVEELEAASLLKPISVEVNDGATGRPHRLQGLQVVDEQKLQALDHARVARFFDEGFLLAVYSHLVSQANYQVLADRFNIQ